MLMFERTIKSLVSYYENKHQCKILKLQNKQLFGEKQNNDGCTSYNSFDLVVV